jgi:hypothetical protein
MISHPLPRSAQRGRKLANILRDVKVGTIRKVDGFPPQWEWRCGFYPGSAPGQYRFGTADQFDQVLIPPRPGLRWVDVGCGTGGFTTTTTAEMAALQLSQTTVSA